MLSISNEQLAIAAKLINSLWQCRENFRKLNHYKIEPFNYVLSKLIVQTNRDIFDDSLFLEPRPYTKNDLLQCMDNIIQRERDILGQRGLGQA